MNGTSSETLRNDDRGESGPRRQTRTWPRLKTVEIRIEQGKDSRFMSEVISGLEVYSDHSLF